MRISTDFLVIGTGAAGLFFALKAAEKGKVLILTKNKSADSNTSYAQGGVAGVFANDDTFEAHVQDTLTAGDGLCRPDVVQMVVREGPQRIQELMNYGAEFDRAPDGSLRLGREGGHSQNRILHNRDATGREISRSLLEAVKKHPNIEIKEGWLAIDVITQHHLGVYVNRGHPSITCYGVYALEESTQTVHTVLARVTTLASGGAGSVYASTTNPKIATGDGVAMAFRAKARITNMEFYQFHPTALYEPANAGPAFLITEALRGKGAILLNPQTMERFMPKYDLRGELAPRDIVARAIDNEMKQYGVEYMLLDASALPDGVLQEEFPNIYEKCKSMGVNVSTTPIPIVPAAHYMCGGIEVDKTGRSSIHRLYAIGECSHTGLHGANRLASNSLLEALVYAHNAFLAASQEIKTSALEENVPEWNADNTENPDEWVLISQNFREVQNLTSNYVGIVRTNLRLERAERRLALIYQETEAFYRRTRLSPELCELRNIIAVAYLIIKCAKIRKESRGLHYNIDYPQKWPAAYDTML